MLLAAMCGIQVGMVDPTLCTVATCGIQVGMVDPTLCTVLTYIVV